VKAAETERWAAVYSPPRQFLVSLTLFRLWVSPVIYFSLQFITLWFKCTHSAFLNNMQNSMQWSLACKNMSYNKNYRIFASCLESQTKTGLMYLNVSVGSLVSQHHITCVLLGLTYYSVGFTLEKSSATWLKTFLVHWISAECSAAWCQNCQLSAAGFIWLVEWKDWKIRTQETETSGQKGDAVLAKQSTRVFLILISFTIKKDSLANLLWNFEQSIYPDIVYKKQPLT